MADTLFPPFDIKSFLPLCDGKWMSLRSDMEITNDGDDDWHSSKRVEHTVVFKKLSEDLGELVVNPFSENTTTLRFEENNV